MTTKKEIREVNGYRAVLIPGHHRSMNGNWEGYVYEHIIVAENSIGRTIDKNEVVHHLDGDRANNRQENLLILDRGQHSKLHSWIDNGVKKQEYCECCGLTLQGAQKRFCSKECYKIGARITERPSIKTLLSEMNSMSILAIGRKYGVTDTAIRKWASSYGIIKENGLFKTK